MEVGPPTLDGFTYDIVVDTYELWVRAWDTDMTRHGYGDMTNP